MRVRPRFVAGRPISRGRSRSLSILVVALFSAVLAGYSSPAWSQPLPAAGAAADPATANPTPAPGPAPLATEVDEAQGQCKTPRQAWLQLLYWLQKEHYDPAKAAACFDTSRLHRPAEEAPELATELIQVLDANGWYIKPTELPADPDYLDPGTKTSTYEDPAVQGKDIVVYRRGGRWLFTPDTLAHIPDMFPGLTVRIVKSLPPWFRSPVLGIQVWKLFGVLVLGFLGLLVQKLVVMLIHGYLRRLISRAQARYLHDAVQRAGRPIGGLAMAGVFYLGLPNLLFPTLIAKIALIATQALAAFSGVWLAYRLIDVLEVWLESKAEKSDTRLDDQLVPLACKTLKVFVSVIGGIFVLQNLDVDVSSLLAGLGLGGLAFALAAKDTVANFFGSLTIFVDKPFHIGDSITLAGVEGIVEEVGFRTTRIRTFYNSLVTMPNSMVTGNMIDNVGARRYRRYSTTLGLAYDTPPDKIRAFCEAVRAVIRDMPGMRQDYYLVEFKEFADFSLNIMLYCFMDVPSWDDELKTRTNLNLEILRIAEQLGVSFAFPTQTLHIDSMVQPGQSKASHVGPQTSPELASVIQGYAPHGTLRHAGPPNISSGGYYHDADIPTAPPAKSDDAPRDG